jgi:hybrid cluster-associated redox disulfide protein
MINKNMSIHEVVRKHPKTIPIFEEFGLGCIGCQAALFENIEEGAKVHGIDVETLITNLNSIVTKR